jgi:hypothetical protein
MAKKKALKAKDIPLPVRLTCHPVIQGGRCVYGLDNGACKKSTEFMCPFYLKFEILNPHKAGEVPSELVEQIRNQRPCPL